MKKLKVIFLVLVLIALALILMKYRNLRQNESDQEKRVSVLLFGDEILDSVYLSYSSEKSKEFKILDKVSRYKIGAEIVTSSLALDYLQSSLDFYVEKPDVVVISLGLEDLRSKYSLLKTRENLETIFQFFKDKEITVLFLGISPPGLGDNWAMSLSQLCGEMNVEFIENTLRGLWGDSDWSSAEALTLVEGWREKVEAKIYDKILKIIR